MRALVDGLNQVIKANHLDFGGPDAIPLDPDGVLDFNAVWAAFDGSDPKARAYINNDGYMVSSQILIHYSPRCARWMGICFSLEHGQPGVSAWLTHSAKGECRRTNRRFDLEDEIEELKRVIPVSPENQQKIESLWDELNDLDEGESVWHINRTCLLRIWSYLEHFAELSDRYVEDVPER